MGGQYSWCMGQMATGGGHARLEEVMALVFR